MRTAIYIDGFNLYHGVVSGTPYKWLDLRQLCQNILAPYHRITSIIYCTARVRNTASDSGKATRQDIYLDALQAYIPQCKPVLGHFTHFTRGYRPVDPRLGPSVEVFRTEEKGTDVNLAVHLVNDAHKDAFDCAVVISNDSDLAEAMRIVKDERRKRVGEAPAPACG